MSSSSEYDYSEGEFASHPSTVSEKKHSAAPAPVQEERKEGWRSSSSSSSRSSSDSSATAKEPVGNPVEQKETPSIKLLDSKLSTDVGSVPMSGDEFAKRLEQQARTAWGPNAPASHNNTLNATTATTESNTATGRRHSKLRSKYYQPSFSQPSAPELQLVTGFEAKVYSELLQVKKDIQRLKYEKDKLTTAHRRVTNDILHEERKYRALLDSEGNLESLKAHKARAKGRSKNIRSACGTLVLSEAARTLACKERMSVMMVDLKGVMDEIKDMKNKRCYKHYERLTEAEGTLQAEMAKLRAKLEKRRNTETVERTTAAIQAVREAITTADITIEHLKKEARRHQVNTAALSHEVKTITEKVDAQNEVKDRLLLKVGETQQASLMKRNTVPIESERLHERLKELGGVTMQKCNELELLKADMSKKIEIQRGLLMSCSEAVERLKGECKEVEGAVKDKEQQLATLQKQVEGVDAWDDVRREYEKQAETEWCRRRTELGALRMKEEEVAEEVKALKDRLRKIKEERHLASERHKEVVSALREGAEKRQETLLMQLNEAYEDPNGRYNEASVSRSPLPDDTFTQTSETDTYQSPNNAEEADVQTAILRRTSPPSNILSPSEEHIPDDEIMTTPGNDGLSVE